jgi:hypothetical protein
MAKSQTYIQVVSSISDKKKYKKGIVKLTKGTRSSISQRNIKLKYLQEYSNQQKINNTKNGEKKILKFSTFTTNTETRMPKNSQNSSNEN